jgi:hypothetical protein
MVSRTPSHLAAALLTIGVSSAPSFANDFRSSSWVAGVAFGYTGEKRAAEEVREVNQSP